MKGFKKCSNGHWYKDDMTQCPFCQGKMAPGNNTATIDGGGNHENTQVFSGLGNEDGNKTIIVGSEKMPSKGIPNKKSVNAVHSATVYEEEFEEETEHGGVIVKTEQRSNRRLVGWLVTYSQDPLGIDYRIFEGRNVVGHDVDCNITVNDKTMSGKHATILFRADKYKIKDELSSHGTFVNDEDIEENTVELHDGDIVKMGSTLFKFKTSF